MSSVMNNIQGIGQINLSSMDLETALMAVQSHRVSLLDTQLKQQIEGVQARNENIGKLNNVLSQLNALDAKFASDAKPETKIGDKASDADVSNLNTAIKTAELSDVFPSGVTFGKDATKSDISSAINKIKSLIDSQSNSQQMDMLRLQSMSNKRNEAFDVMTNFVKKMQDNRSSILGNMR